MMISSSKKISFAKAKKLVINLIDGDHAKHKFYQWIKNQGGDITKLKGKAKRVQVKAKTSGYINSIDSNKLAQLVFDLGAGRVKKTDKIDYSVGIVLNKVVGDKVTKGETLATIHYNSKVENMSKILEESYKIENKI